MPIPSVGNKPAHEVKRLIEETGNRQESNDSGEEDQRGKKRHHEIVGQSGAHLQSAVALNIGIGSNDRRLYFPDLHSALDAICLEDARVTGALSCGMGGRSNVGFFSGGHTKQSTFSSSKIERSCFIVCRRMCLQRSQLPRGSGGA